MEERVRRKAFEFNIVGRQRNSIGYHVLTIRPSRRWWKQCAYTGLVRRLSTRAVALGLGLQAIAGFNPDGMCRAQCLSHRPESGFRLDLL